MPVELIGFIQIGVGTPEEIECVGIVLGFVQDLSIPGTQVRLRMRAFHERLVNSMPFEEDGPVIESRFDELDRFLWRQPEGEPVEKQRIGGIESQHFLANLDLFLLFESCHHANPRFGC